MPLDYFYGQVGELFSFYRIPKALFLESRFQNLSTDAKTLYGILLDRMSLSAKNGWLDEQGRVFIIFTIEDILVLHLHDYHARCFHSLRDALYDCFSTDTAPHTHANVSTKHTVTASCAPRPP